MTKSIDRRTHIYTGLRKLANLLEAHEELQVPYSINLAVFNTEAESSAKQIRSVSKVLGSFKKIRSYDNDVGLQVKLAPRFTCTWYFNPDQICTRRVIGVQKIKKRIYPDNIAYQEIEHNVEIVEWDCPTLLGEESTAD